MNVAERRLTILEILSVKRQETRKNLAEKLNVSKGTIDNDILALSLIYPVFTTQGNGGGIRLMDGYSYSKPGFTSKQFELLDRLLNGLDGEDRETMLEILKFGGRRENHERQST